MSTVEEIRFAIEHLSHSEQRQLRHWFLEQDSTQWDRKLDRDIESGKLDTLAENALAEHKAGKTKEL